jgi:hypothetical protein
MRVTRNRTSAIVNRASVYTIAETFETGTSGPQLTVVGGMQLAAFNRPNCPRNRHQPSEMRGLRVTIRGV